MRCVEWIHSHDYSEGAADEAITVCLGKKTTKQITIEELTIQAKDIIKQLEEAIK